MGQRIHRIAKLSELPKYDILKGTGNRAKVRCKVGKCGMLASYYCQNCSDLGADSVFGVCGIDNKEGRQCFYEHAEACVNL